SNYGTPTMSNGADATCEVDGLGGTKDIGDQSPVKAASDSPISGLFANSINDYLLYSYRLPRALPTTIVKWTRLLPIQSSGSLIWVFPII
ncbi:hypothetical protein Ancab_028417, partial [Ancistrocladus abbreviatus]